MFFSRRNLSIIFLLPHGLCATQVSLNTLDQAINTDLATNKASIQSQKKINRLSDQAQSMLEKYRTASRELENVQTYNKHLEDLVASQVEEKISLTDQLQEIETTQQEMVPLVLRMMESLESFIQLDMPFLQKERQQRIKNLKSIIVRADVTNAEKYRRILEAYQVENEYGHTIEAYRGDLELAGKKTTVDFLRLGRVALYYQRLDGSESGFWSKENKQWKTLDSEYRNGIKKGLEIAREEVAPDLLTLPIPTPEAAK